MGLICNISKLGKLMCNYVDYPIISCLALEYIKNKFPEFKLLSLGELLSYELIKLSKNERNSSIEQLLYQILYKINANRIIITDIDILFNPGYRLDIMKLFVQLARNRRIIILWPGEYVSESLIYAAPGYKDYKKYSIKDYNIICLSKGD